MSNTEVAIFATAAPRYHALGWSPIPLDKGTKWPPLPGFTGYQGLRPTEKQVSRWVRDKPDANVALRLPTDVAGVDVDAYHGGLAGLAELQARFGQLPPTWASSSRDDGSGIRLYRIPTQWHLKTDPAEGVDMIQAHHRYVVAAPSIHPEGRQYRWIDLAEEETIDQFDIAPTDLPELPWGWLNGLRVLGAGKKAQQPATADRVYIVLNKAEPLTGYVAPDAIEGIRTALAAWNGTSRHGHLLTTACWAMREAAADLYSAKDAVALIEAWWQSVMADNPRRRDGGEFGSAIAWAIAEADADPGRIQEIRDKAAGRERRTFTDQGNARRLVVGHGEFIRHVPQLGCWFRWEGTYWEEDITGEVMRRAKATADSILDEAQGLDDDDRKKVVKHWLASQDASRLRAMVFLASTEPSIPVRIDELDTDPWMLNTATCTIDLRSGTEYPHRRDDLMTKRAAEYKPGSPVQAWLSFLERIFDGDVELIDFVQRSAGIALTGDVSEQYLWFLHGAGANGKTTFLNALRRATGDYSIQIDVRMLLASDHDQHPTGLTDLRGVRLATTAEVDQERKLAESLVKQLTGGDAIRARRMHKDSFEFSPTHKLWMASNHLPRIAGTDHAIWRRILLVPFTQTFEGDQVDRQLPAKLAAETPGILAWAVEGCAKWLQDGLQIPEKVLAATANYRANEDHVGRFLADCFASDPNDFVQASTLRETYVGWCASAGEREWTAMSLGQELTKRGYDSVKVGGKKRWLGMRAVDGLDLRGVA